MNPLQKKQFALLEQFAALCSRLGLRWYLVRGSALGAVKYGGFIPWDDDIDVALPRRDYDLFVSRAQELLPDHIFVQTSESDPAFPKLYCKLRDTSGTFVEAPYRKLNVNHGVFIDVFPLDGYPEDAGERETFHRTLRRYLRRTSCALELPRSLRGALFCALLRLMGYHRRTRQDLAALTDFLRRCPAEDSALWCSCGNFRGRLLPMNREIYGDGTDMSFEGLAVRVPAQFDAYLRTLYGDYTADLPPEERVGHHHWAVLEPNTPCGGERK